MAISKVIYGQNTLIDLTNDTVTSASHIVKGHTGHLADGTQVTGTASDEVAREDIVNSTGTTCQLTGSILAGEKEEKEVTFYDYDGTILYAYTTEEFLALSSMPTPASDSELASSGWNWSFADAKTWVTKYGMLAIGNMRYPKNCSVRIIVNPEAGETLTVTKSNGSWSGTINWGDETIDSLANNISHTYLVSGHYIIQIFTATGETYQVDLGGNKNMVDEINLGLSATGEIYTNRSYGDNCRFISLPHGLTTIRGNFMTGRTATKALIYPDTLTTLGMFDSNYDNAIAVSYPNNTLGKIANFPKAGMITVKTNLGTIGGNTAMSLCKYFVLSDECTELTQNQRYQSIRCLKKIYLSPNITNTGTYLFTDLQDLKKLVLPKSMTVISNATFTNLYSLEELTLPPNVTTINGLTNILKLKSLIIPETVTNIAANSFSTAVCLREIHFRPTTPPTIGSTATFSDLNSTCIIYVPYSADHSILTAYQEATNLSRYASQMVEEESE